MASILDSQLSECSDVFASSLQTPQAGLLRGVSALATAASGSRHASLGDPNFWLASGCAHSNLSLHG